MKSRLFPLGLMMLVAYAAAACGPSPGGETANDPPEVKGSTPPGETSQPVGADTTGGTATTAGLGTAGSTTG